jgi:enamine deaminase RidA (YjgF/YER057c/UK114 family)
MVEVRRLIDPDMLIEIEADAVVLSDASDNLE